MQRGGSTGRMARRVPHPLPFKGAVLHHLFNFDRRSRYCRKKSINARIKKLAGAVGFEPTPSALTVQRPTNWTTPQADSLRAARLTS